jgi:hypothetical protein
MSIPFRNYFVVLALIALSVFNFQFSTAQAQGTTAFTFQGRLNTTGGPATGSYDMTFAIYDANVAGDLIAGPITNSAVSVSNGLFTVALDFGSGVFTGTNYWVQMAVSPAGANTFSTLVPRQQLTPAPYSISLIAPQTYALCPPGSVMAFAGANVPVGWLLCDGSVMSSSQYPALFAAISTNWGMGTSGGIVGTNDFNLPDLRGMFLRGVNGTRINSGALNAQNSGLSMDPDVATRTNGPDGGNAGNAVGSLQGYQLQSHSHAWGSFYNSGWAGGSVPGYIHRGDAADNTQTPTTSTGGAETRPQNAYVNYIIKY